MYFFIRMFEYTVVCKVDTKKLIHISYVPSNAYLTLNHNYFTIPSLYPSYIENVFINCKTRYNNFYLIVYDNYEFANN